MDAYLENCLNNFVNIFNKGIEEIKTSQKPRIGYEQGYYDGYIESLETQRDTILTVLKGLKKCSEIKTGTYLVQK